MSRWERERRLDYIDDRLAHGLTVNRADIMQAFDVSVAQASLCLRDYLGRLPRRKQATVRYNKSLKRYEPTPGFESVRRSSPERRAAWAQFDVPPIR